MVYVKSKIKIVGGEYHEFIIDFIQEVENFNENNEYFFNRELTEKIEAFIEFIKTSGGINITVKTIDVKKVE